MTIAQERAEKPVTIQCEADETGQVERKAHFLVRLGGAMNLMRGRQTIAPTKGVVWSFILFIMFISLLLRVSGRYPTSYIRHPEKKVQDEKVGIVLEQIEKQIK